MKQHLFSFLLVVVFVLGCLVGHSVHSTTETVSGKFTVTVSSLDDAPIVVPSIEYALPEIVIYGKSTFQDKINNNCDDGINYSVNTEAYNQIDRNRVSLYALLEHRILYFASNYYIRINNEPALSLPEDITDSFVSHGVYDPYVANARAPGSHKKYKIYRDLIINSKGA